MSAIPSSRDPGSAAAALESDIAALSGLDLYELRVRWRQRLRRVPPPTLSRPLLLRLLAYRLQERVWGGLDGDTARYLDRIAREAARRLAAGERRRARAVPVIPPVPSGGLKPGTLLVREHAGEMHRITVVVGGFSWRDATYTSLSQVARAITGTAWSGPRFFGLREGGEAA